MSNYAKVKAIGAAYKLKMEMDALERELVGKGINAVGLSDIGTDIVRNVLRASRKNVAKFYEVKVIVPQRINHDHTLLDGTMGSRILQRNFGNPMNSPICNKNEDANWQDYANGVSDVQLGSWGVDDIDPSGMTNKNHQTGFNNMMKSQEFRTFVGRYASKGDKITIGNKIYTFNKTGDRAKDRLVLHSANMGANGIAMSYKKFKNIQVSISHLGSMEKVVTEGVREVIYLKNGINVDQSTTTLAHEAFVHADKDADRLNEIDTDARAGKYNTDLGKKDFMNKKRRVGNSKKKDHADLKKGTVKKFKKALQEINRSDLYQRNRNKHIKYDL